MASTVPNAAAYSRIRRIAACWSAVVSVGLSSAAAGDVRWPETDPATPAGHVSAGVRQVLFALDPAPPARFPEQVAAPLNQSSAGPQALQLPPAPPPESPPGSPGQGGLPETAPPDAPGYGIKPLRELEIQVAPLREWTNFEGTKSNLELPANDAAELFPNVKDLTGPANGWFEMSSTGHVACVDFHPLYFEELSLERYGDSFGCWQPLISAVHFYSTVPMLPYKLVSEPFCSYESSCEYPPAATPAGRISCRRPLNFRAAAFEVGVIAATILLIP